MAQPLGACGQPPRPFGFEADSAPPRPRCARPGPASA